MKDNSEQILNVIIENENKSFEILDSKLNSFEILDSKFNKIKDEKDKEKD
jgi:hypothetical protein